MRLSNALLVKVNKNVFKEKLKIVEQQKCIFLNTTLIISKA